MPYVYNQDEGRFELDIKGKKLPTHGVFRVSKSTARQWRQYNKNLGSALIVDNDSLSTVKISGFLRCIIDQVTPRNPRKGFSQALIRCQLEKRWQMLLREHGKQEQKQDENEMKPEDIKQLLEQQTAEIKTIVSANSKWAAIWPPFAIGCTVFLALLALYIAINRDMRSFGKDLSESQETLNNNVNKQLMDFRKDVSQIQTTIDKGFSDTKAELSQFEVRLTTDVNKQLMDFRKDLSQSQQTILEQIQKAQPTKQQ